MKKALLSFLMACFAFVCVAQAQINVETVNVTMPSDFTAMVAADRATTDGVWITYAPDELDEVTAVGIGMGFSWGSMFPASVLSPYAGTSLTQVGFLDLGDPQFAGTYTVNIYLGGDTQGETLVCTQSFELTGTLGDVVEIPLNTPVAITGTQNLWVMYYQDGSVEHPAPAAADLLGDPNNRWIAIEGLGWYDLASVGGEGYAWLLWAYLDGYDLIGESNDAVAVYPNPSNGTFYLNLGKGQWNVEVYDITGRKVYENQHDGLSALDLGQCQKGLYFLKAVGESKELTTRIVIK